ncbi:PAS/PAC sensor hybrid histidine kinase precursor [Minicystis rosea]|nr:PAS/PAC sensor hybrid histidine kinase precursor [Minicystis rosea]
MTDLRAAVAHAGTTGALLASLDWSATPLGPIEGWPASLAVPVRMVLGSGFPLCLMLGSAPTSARVIYNDAYIPFLGEKHPTALGLTVREVWPEIWDILGWALAHVWHTGQPVTGKDLSLRVERGGQIEEISTSISFSAITDDDGRVSGALACGIETTASVVSERRERMLRVLAEELGAARSESDLHRRIEAALSAASKDIPFALLYLRDRRKATASLRADVGLAGDAPERFRKMDLRDDASSEWDVGRVIATGEMAVVRFEEDALSLSAIALGSAPQSAVVVPVACSAQDRALGALVAGLSPVNAFDEGYRCFLRRVAREIATALVDVRRQEETRRRAESLLELDRAKTMFLTHVGHELRTPLTLILGPVEDMLADGAEPLTPTLRAELDRVRRNAHRLMREVEALLDFARVDVGRVKVVYEPTDLAGLTREAARAFEPAATRAGLGLTIDCPSLPEPVFVAPNMWEQVIFNLVSNALKFTFEGAIEVRLCALDNRVRLTVRDTGTGIPADALPRLFERFYRVPHARARNAEGLGIGLALVKQIVRLHKGSIHVQSAPGQGTTFVIEIPRGKGHLPPERTVAATSSANRPPRAASIANDVLAWPAEPLEPAPAAARSAGAGRILVAEDDPEMRDYLVRLLAPIYEVEAVPDGAVALARAEANPPALILSDIIMPELDGLRLVHELRNDSRTSSIPVILLSARGGNDAAVEALGSGADDYLVKPFGARELLARVRTHLELARARRDAAESRLKDVFLGLASHELRTPLTCLKLNVQLVQHKVDKIDPVLGARIMKLNTSIDRLTRLVEDMLNVSAIVGGQIAVRKRPCDLGEVCRSAAAEQSMVTRRALSLELPDAPVLAVADDERIGEVVSNLLSNAFKYSAPDRPVTLALRASSQEAIVTVRDEGAGIAAEQLSHIFERFYRVPGQGVQSGSYVGLGLGLFLSKAIVEQHRGRIWVESAPGEGSAFSFAVPLAA